MTRRPTSAFPETYHRVVKGESFLRSPNVSPAGVVGPNGSDLSGLTTTTSLRAASAWRFDRAMFIARMFPGAYVDRVAADIGSTDEPWIDERRP